MINIKSHVYAIIDMYPPIPLSETKENLAQTLPEYSKNDIHIVLMLMIANGKLSSDVETLTR